MQNFRTLVLLTSVAVLTACGGGGGESAPEPTPTPIPAAATPAPAATPSFIGNYNVTMSMTGNTCSLTGLPQSIVASQSIWQSDRTVQVLSGTTVFDGSVDSDNLGFNTSNTQTVSGYVAVSNMNYRGASATSSYSVQYTISTAGCLVVWNGTATRF